MNQEFQPPQGYELDKENSTDEKLIYKKKENQYPLSWEEYMRIEPEVDFWLHGGIGLYVPEKYKALGKLELLRDAWNEIDGFKADWTDGSQSKYGIENYNNDIHGDVYWLTNRIIYFGSPKTRNLFRKTFKNLIETAKELL